MPTETTHTFQVAAGANDIAVQQDPCHDAFFFLNKTVEDMQKEGLAQIGYALATPDLLREVRLTGESMTSPSGIEKTDMLGVISIFDARLLVGFLPEGRILITPRDVNKSTPHGLTIEMLPAVELRLKDEHDRQHLKMMVTSEAEIATRRQNLKVFDRPAAQSNILQIVRKP
jgi:hypothetical protein